MANDLIKQSLHALISCEGFGVGVGDGVADGVGVGVGVADGVGVGVGVADGVGVGVGVADFAPGHVCESRIPELVELVSAQVPDWTIRS